MKLSELKGRIVLDDSGLVGDLIVGQDNKSAGRLERLGVGIPGYGWLQETSGRFEGYWVHANEKGHNTLIKKNQEGWYAVSKGSDNFQAYAAGNVMFLFKDRHSGIWDAVLSLDGQTLTINVRERLALAVAKIELRRRDP
jgi:hypothetical protein